MRLLSEAERKKAWDEVYVRFHFYPSLTAIPFQMSTECKVFSLDKYWSVEQNNEVNEIFCAASCDEIYALDWQHDCFSFRPEERIPVGLTWYDDERDVNVYFPEYYPDGDYHFFIAKDFAYGMMGHPWRKELWVFGHDLIEQIEKHSTILGLSVKKDL